MRVALMMFYRMNIPKTSSNKTLESCGINKENWLLQIKKNDV